MKKILTLLLLLPAMFVAAQIDTATLRQYYDRAIDFSADKTDSMLYFARLLDKASVEQHFTRGKVLATRLKGLAADMSGDYDLAITWYLQSLEEARRLGEARYIITALSDLAILYDQIKQPEKAMQYYLESLPLLRQLNEISMLLPAYNNLAVIYSHLGNYDSALLLLQESLEYRNQMGDRVDFSSTLNNLGTIYFRKGDYKKALQYFKENYTAHEQLDDVEKLWLDHLNLADNYSELKQLDSAEKHANMALEDALRLNSKSKEADSYSILSKVQERKGNYKQAFRFLKKWYTLDSTLINIETGKTIAALQEKYNAKQRDEDNKILLAGIEREKIQNQNITLIAFTLGSIAILSVLAFMAIRNANKKLKLANQALNKQKENLAELNEEKNALIGIVSHDLHSPFAGIEVWCRLLESEKQRLSDEQIKALERIREAGTYGQNLINRILDVERETGSNTSLEIAALNMNELLQDMADQYAAMAAQKQIELSCLLPKERCILHTDAALLRRAIDNLLSNALKFTPPHKKVRLELQQQQDALTILVSDEGPGIPAEELPLLFRKYARLSAQPTNNETSNGMGLFIVKRIADRLNARIECHSEPGKGSSFNLLFAK